MARRPIRVKEPLGVVQRRNRAYMDMMVPKEGPQRERFEAMFPESDLTPLPVKRGPRVDTGPLEADVVRAVGELLARHPRVSYALRINSGMASYEAKSGRYAPVYFHKWVRSPTKCRMPDFFGATTDGRTIALECKRPGWTKPTDDREREQAAFLNLIFRMGGIADFITDAAQVNALLAL